MSTSGSSNYTVTASDIITEALELLGVLGEGESYTSNQYASCLRTLNMMTKLWQAEGLNLFAVQRMYLFLIKGQKEYNLSNTTTDNFTSSFVQSATVGTALSGTYQITVQDVSGLSNGMYLGVQTSETDMFWTTISSISGTTLNLLGALPSDVAEGAVVYAYTTKANRPMRVLEAFVRRNPFSPTPIDIPIGMISRVDYNMLSTKDTQAQVVQMYFDPQRTQANVAVWPTSATEVDFIVLNCQRTLDDFDASSDEPDYPQEWFLALAYNLAVLIAPKYGVPANDFSRIQNIASGLHNTVEGWDSEQETSVYFKPDTWGNDIGRRGN